MNTLKSFSDSHQSEIRREDGEGTDVIFDTEGTSRIPVLNARYQNSLILRKMCRKGSEMDKITMMIHHPNRQDGEENDDNAMHRVLR